MREPDLESQEQPAKGVRPGTGSVAGCSAEVLL